MVSALSLYRMNEPTTAGLCAKSEIFFPLLLFSIPSSPGMWLSSSSGQGCTQAWSMRSRCLGWLSYWKQQISFNKQQQQGSDSTKVTVDISVCEIAVSDKYVNIYLFFVVWTCLTARYEIVFLYRCVCFQQEKNKTFIDLRRLELLFCCISHDELCFSYSSTYCGDPAFLLTAVSCQNSHVITLVPSHLLILPTSLIHPAFSDDDHILIPLSTVVSQLPGCQSVQLRHQRMSPTLIFVVY